MGIDVAGIYERLAHLFSRKQVKLELKEAGSARALAAQQHALYRTLLNAFQDIPFGTATSHTGSVSTSNNFREVFGKIFKYTQDKAPQAREVGSEIVVEYAFPILDDAEVQSFVEYIQGIPEGPRTAEEASEYAFAVTAAIIAETPAVEASRLEPSATDVERERVAIATSKYVATKIALDYRHATGLAMSREVAAAQGQLANYKADFARDHLERRAQLDALAAAVSEIRDSQSMVSHMVSAGLEDLQNSIQKHKADFDEAAEGTRRKLDTFETSTLEKMKLEGIRLNWGRRFKEARWAFRLGCLFLLIYLVVTIGVATIYGLPIVQALANVEQTPGASHLDPITRGVQGTAPAGDQQANDTSSQVVASPSVSAMPQESSVAVALIHQFGRLIVFSVPVFVWLWMGRALMRYFMRSMLLMDDARQRQTMLDTYFLLSDEGKADERDRPLVLWALFRQTPGHGPDGIDPPDFTEVIRAGLERAKG